MGAPVLCLVGVGRPGTGSAGAVTRRPACSVCARRSHRPTPSLATVPFAPRSGSSVVLVVGLVASSGRPWSSRRLRPSVAWWLGWGAPTHGRFLACLETGLSAFDQTEGRVGSGGRARAVLAAGEAELEMARPRSLRLAFCCSGRFPSGHCLPFSSPTRCVTHAEEEWPESWGAPRVLPLEGTRPSCHVKG